ncbi:MAG: hypothetical protein MHMPM18_004998, partial [Marteilia pararefringens]
PNEQLINPNKHLLNPNEHLLNPNEQLLNPNDTQQRLNHSAGSLLIGIQHNCHDLIEQLIEQQPWHTLHGVIKFVSKTKDDAEIVQWKADTRFEIYKVILHCMFVNHTLI